MKSRTSGISEMLICSLLFLIKIAYIIDFNGDFAWEKHSGYECKQVLYVISEIALNIIGPYLHLKLTSVHHLFNFIYCQQLLLPTDDFHSIDKACEPHLLIPNWKYSPLWRGPANTLYTTEASEFFMDLYLLVHCTEEK